MSIKQDIYFLISPKESLIARIRELNMTTDPSILDLLIEKVVWKNSYSLPITIRVDQIKIIYIAELYSYFIEDNSNSQNLDLFQQIIGKPPYLKDIFDNWWRIQRILYYEIEKEVSHLPSDIIDLFKINKDHFSN